MPKIYAACGAAGFVLSFVVGIFSGASFFLLLVRALIFGAVFAALAVLFAFLQKRFAPDLFDTNAVAVAAPKPKTRGAKLDITISDDKDAAPEEEDSSVPDFMKDRSRGKSDAPSASAGKGEEPKEESPASEEAQGAAAPADEAMAANDAPSEDATAPAFGQNAEGGLADMPEETSFPMDAEEEEEEALPPPHPQNGGSPKNPAHSLGADVDTMAKAIRTVLAKGE